MWQIIGQKKATSLLQRGLEKRLLSHAYLLVGPPHIGKMTLALKLAQAVNCEGNEPPCGECAPCQKIASAKHADVQIINLSKNGTDKPQTEISIDRIREVQHSSNLPPFEGKYRVFIIDGAEFLSIEAANCLLKTLEEPSDRVIFTLLTSNERLLPATVVSRCQRLELSPLPVGEMEAAVGGRGVEPEKAKLLARLSHGCPGWALSAAFDDSLLQQRGERLEQIVGAIKGDYNSRFVYAARLATQFGQNQALVYEVLNLWLDWWRDLLLFKTGNNDQAANIDFGPTLAELSKYFTLIQIKAAINGIQAAREQLKLNANPQLVLEVLMLNIPRRRNA